MVVSIADSISDSTLVYPSIMWYLSIQFSANDNILHKIVDNIRQHEGWWQHLLIEGQDWSECNFVGSKHNALRHCSQLNQLVQQGLEELVPLLSSWPIGCHSVVYSLEMVWHLLSVWMKVKRQASNHSKAVKQHQLSHATQYLSPWAGIPFEDAIINYFDMISHNTAIWISWMTDILQLPIMLCNAFFIYIC